jgi:hypothetical protein
VTGGAPPPGEQIERGEWRRSSSWQQIERGESSERRRARRASEARQERRGGAEARRAEASGGGERRLGFERVAEKRGKCVGEKRGAGRPPKWPRCVAHPR